MIKLVVSSIAVAAVTAGAAAPARAQVCIQPSPGVAEIHTATTPPTTTIKIVGGIPRANSVSCGFAATAIRVVGNASGETITFNYVSPQIPITIALGGGADTVRLFGSAGDDTIVCGAAGLDRDGDGTIDLELDAVPALAIYGQAGDDVIDCKLYPIKAKLFGRDGDDTIDGTAGNDVLDGGNGHDTIHGGDGNDTIRGGNDDDTLSGGNGNDTFPALAGFDGRDQLAGDAGTDTASYTLRTTGVAIGGPNSEDAIGADLERIRGGAGADVLDFSAATTPRTLFGGGGNDGIRGGTGADRIFGDAGSDTLRGGAGKDVIDGGDGNDVLDAGPDGVIETITCGAGRDWYPAGTADLYAGCEHALGHRLAASNASACAILADGTVRCWGANGYGNLGLGDANHRGDQPGEMGAALPAVDLGTASGVPHTARALAGGYLHMCALLDDGGVKCWGANNNGQLGQGDTSHRGDAPDEMGDALPAVDLGTGRTAIAISAANYQTCALLDNGAVKCWGWGQYGGLGQGDNVVRGNSPGEMGDALPPIALGTGRTATAIQAYENYVCALLDDSSVKCWGANSIGQLGIGDSEHRGDDPGEMGDALPAVDLGTGRIAVRLAQYTGGLALNGGFSHACAQLDDGTVKCWGAGHGGVLGSGDTINRGDQPGEMGDALPVVDFGAGRVPAALAVGSWFTCGVLADGAMKCFGINSRGSLGQGDIVDRGDQPGEMGDGLPAIQLGTGRTATGLALGEYLACAGLDDGSVKCWGYGWAGIGLGNTATVGDKPDQMGDALPIVQLGGVMAREEIADGAPAAGDDALGELDAPASDRDDSDGADDDDEPSGGCAAGPGGSGLPVALLWGAWGWHRRRRIA
jgi:uncharacterized protein (TIGR03382 family)